MKNFTKILCVVLALVVALSAASCSLTKQYAYKKDKVELPVGVYIYYLYSAYGQAQSLAQQSDKYDSETGKYDGKKSFLSMTITNNDGNEAVAQDWIKDTAIKSTKRAIAVCRKFNELGCTIDEIAPTDKFFEVNPTAQMYAQYYAQSGITEDTTVADMAANYEQYGISVESYILCEYSLVDMENEVFKAEYAADGPSAVSDKEIADYFKENYTSYKAFSVDLYTTTTVESEDGSEETSTTNTPLSDDEIAAYQKAFNEYASDLSKGGSYDDVIAKYMKAYEVETDPTQSGVEVIGEDASDELHKTLKDMKDGQAMTIEVGDDTDAKQLMLVYREPIENQLESYSDREQNGMTVLREMKTDEFKDLIDGMLKDYKLLPACNSYKPSMFEESKK